MTQAGVISRLEAVSMIPPLFLDVHPDHLVLDLCAAPGSKTQQLLEMLKSGVIVANDANPQRALMLVNQTSHAPTTKLVVTSYLAQQFPVPRNAGKPVQFDRILCDVPCSGDGTLVGFPREWDLAQIAGDLVHVVAAVRAVAAFPPTVHFGARGETPQNWRQNRVQHVLAESRGKRSRGPRNLAASRRSRAIGRRFPPISGPFPREWAQFVGGDGLGEPRDSRGERGFEGTFHGETVVFPAKRRGARRRAPGIRHALSPPRAEPRGILRVRAGENRGTARDVRPVARR